jgi:hypothetical protein
MAIAGVGVIMRCHCRENSSGVFGEKREKTQQIREYEVFIRLCGKELICWTQGSSGYP